jgi:hypothetical protein
MSSILLQNNNLLFDSYNFGINQNDLSISYTKTPHGLKILSSDEIENPLFVSENGGSLNNTNLKEIFQRFSRIIVVCLRENYDDTEDLCEIYNKVINKKTISNVVNNFVFFESSTNLLKNTYYKYCANVVSKDLLTTLFNLEESDLENEEIVLPMFELTTLDAHLCTSVYESHTNLNTFKYLNQNTHSYKLNQSVSKFVNGSLSDHLSNIKESKYWTKSENCKINMTNVFMHRKFMSRSDKNIHDIVLKQCIDNEEKDGDKKEINNYMSFNNSCSDHCDIYGALVDQKHRTFYLENVKSLNFTKENITQMFMNLKTEKQQYNFFNALAVSKEYCHTVINNKTILIEMKPLFRKYAPVYKLIFGYAWLTLTLEEYIMKTKTTIENRYVFDIDTAHHLPVFPFLLDDLHQNPYIVLPISKKCLTSDNLIASHFITSFTQIYGICSLNEFNERFNIFTSGNINRNIFNNINWSNIAISGSCIAACLQKTPVGYTLMHGNWQSKESKEESWTIFFDKYYKNSDIDLMCNVNSTYEFIEKLDHVVDTLAKNIGCDKDIINVESVKSLYICLTQDFFELNKDNINDSLCKNYTVKELLEICNTSEFKEYIYPLYITQKQKFNTETKKKYSNMI